MTDYITQQVLNYMTGNSEEYDSHIIGLYIKNELKTDPVILKLLQYKYNCNKKLIRKFRKNKIFNEVDISVNDFYIEHQTYINTIIYLIFTYLSCKIRGNINYTKELCYFFYVNYTDRFNFKTGFKTFKYNYNLYKFFIETILKANPNLEPELNEIELFNAKMLIFMIYKSNIILYKEYCKQFIYLFTHNAFKDFLKYMRIKHKKTPEDIIEEIKYKYIMSDIYCYIWGYDDLLFSDMSEENALTGRLLFKNTYDLLTNIIKSEISYSIIRQAWITAVIMKNK